MCGKHWFSLAQTHMAPQPKLKNEAEACQGSKINIIMAPRDTQKRPKRAKRLHKRPYVRQNDAWRRDLKARRRELKARRRDLKAQRRDLKVRQPETGGLPGGDRPRCTDRPPQKATGALKSRPGAPRRGTRGRQGGAVGHLNERHAAAFVDKI